MAIPAFLSYSHEDRRLAAEIKNTLDRYDLDTFLAHEDLQPSAEWQRVIFQKLKECEVFLPLLTNSFKKSDWTDQETGIAVARNKIIVPIKVTVNPYGFIARYQAQTLSNVEDSNAVDIEDACWNIMKTLAAHSKVGASIKNGVIRMFGESRSWSQAGRNAERLRSLEPFTNEQLNEIVRLSGVNSEIYHGFDARSYVRDLIERQATSIDKKLVRRFEQMAS